MLDVTALGELLIDFAPAGADEKGYPILAAHPGGAPANFLAALTRYGARTAFLGKVGADAFGDLLIKTVAEAGIETRGILRDPAVFTTLAFVTLDGNGEREFSFARKPGADTMLRPVELDLSLIDDAKVFHFGSLSLTNEPARSATRAAVAYAKERGKLITYDPNLRRPLWDSLEEAREQMLWGLRQADVVKISDEEVRFLFDLDEVSAAKKLLSEYGVKLVFVTLGKDGCYYSNGAISGRIPEIPGIHPVDTTGAGDIFGGAAVSGILAAQKSPEELTAEELHSIAAFACTAASLSTQHPGGISSVPDRSKVEEWMEGLIL